MAHKAGHIEDWYKDEGMGGSWEDSPDGKGIGDTWYLPDTKDDIPLIEDFPEEKKPSTKYDWLPGVRDYFTDDFLEDVGGVGGVLGDMEWGKIGINSLLNAPEQLLDLATFWPHSHYTDGYIIKHRKRLNHSPVNGCRGFMACPLRLPLSRDQD